MTSRSSNRHDLLVKAIRNGEEVSKIRSIVENSNEDPATLLRGIYNGKQIPLHEACAQLKHIEGKNKAEKWIQVVTFLAETFPEALRMRDGSDGETPLHKILHCYPSRREDPQREYNTLAVAIMNRMLDIDPEIADIRAILPPPGFRMCGFASGRRIRSSSHNMTPLHVALDRERIPVAVQALARLVELSSAGTLMLQPPRWDGMTALSQLMRSFRLVGQEEEDIRFSRRNTTMEHHIQEKHNRIEKEQATAYDLIIQTIRKQPLAAFLRHAGAGYTALFDACQCGMPLKVVQELVTLWPMACLCLVKSTDQSCPPPQFLGDKKPATKLEIPYHLCSAAGDGYRRGPVVVVDENVRSYLRVATLDCLSVLLSAVHNDKSVNMPPGVVEHVKSIVEVDDDDASSLLLPSKLDEVSTTKLLSFDPIQQMIGYKMRRRDGDGQQTNDNELFFLLHGRVAMKRCCAAHHDNKVSALGPLVTMHTALQQLYCLEEETEKAFLACALQHLKGHPSLFL